jgi:hypothetical protein
VGVDIALAALVDREDEKLQTLFLTGMVKSREVECSCPEAKNRPDQAYRLVVKREP